jgi:hypothetical protein
MNAFQLSKDDSELLQRLQSVLSKSHVLTAQIVRLLMNVEERDLYARLACSSLFEFCVRKLGMSEGAAYRRINAARLARRFPTILGRIERGEVHLSMLVLLRDHLSEESADALLDGCRGKSQREVAEMLAQAETPMPTGGSLRKHATTDTTEVMEPLAKRRAEPVAEDRYRLELTITRATRDKLEHARDLLMHANPTGDLSVVVERALDTLLDKLEKQRLGKVAEASAAAASAAVEPPAPTPTASAAPPASEPRPPAKTSGIPRSVRREVFARDGAQCTFVSADGERCAERGGLELDHIVPQAHGGSNEASNLRVLCRTHNQLAAKDAFGKDHVQAKIDLRRRKRAEARNRSAASRSDAAKANAVGFV